MPSTMQMQSISDIITQIHVTMEEVPPALVGASINVIDDKVYVFAGRLATSRKMTNYLYILDLNTLCWTRHIPPPDSDKPPKARYFHSTSVYNNKHIIVFGGMGYSRVSTDGLCVLDDISILDIETMCWRKPSIQPSLYSPQPRYAHLSTISEDKLLVIGGQDLENNYIDEMNILNLKTWEWEQMKSLEKHVGAYRSISVKAPSGARFPAAAATLNLMNNINNNNNSNNDDINDETDNDTSNEDNSNNCRRISAVRPSSVQATTDEISSIYLYTNYNFADVKRELQLIFPSPQGTLFEDCSNYLNGSIMPPGLRFPTGHTLGNHLILAGTHLSPQSQSYTIWSLDFSKLTWSRIETGTIFSTGSWNRGVLHENTNRFIVFGNSNRNLLDDYNHRQINFDHLAMVDLEAFGVYSLPNATCSTLAQEMGLRLLNEPAISDFYIMTQDNLSVPVNSAIICQRWPYFANLMKNNQQIVVATPPTSKRSSRQLEENKEESASVNEDDKEDKGISLIKSRYMSFPYPHAVVIALLQFIYTDNLLTAQQYQPHILCQLLLLSDMYDIPRLRELATHALHQMLNMSTAPLIFETAALSHRTSLQIRALKMMIAAKKMIQQQQQLHQQQQQQQQSPSPQQSQNQNIVRLRTVSTPAVVAVTSSLMDPPLPISPTASLSSSSYNTTRFSSFEPNSNVTSAFSSRSRKPSLNNNGRSTLQQRGSTISSSNSNHLYASSNKSPVNYSPPVTPLLHQRSDPIDLSSSSGNNHKPNNAIEPSSKPKKKKKAFLEAFGKLSSISFQNNNNNS
ncbi:MAG: hypothetical protein EXX96DRAFT_574453 [Benjaminiella poitrasii]|nr:MAG: hypothetical protein EXX96DRAFT_574453 [Benjaminiella poitrasii]